MGTRNITSVIMNGKQVVCQYGQWDGYPGYTGKKILEFLRDADLDRFKKALENTNISVVDYDNAQTYTGSTKDVSDISDQVYKEQTTLNKDRKPEDPFWGTYETVMYMLEEGKLSAQQVDAYLTSTRDTGCEILSHIYNRAQDIGPLALSAIRSEYDGDYSFDIQGVYVVDLDNNVVKMRYDGYTQEYDINNLPADIGLKMQVFEEVTREMYELTSDNFDFSALSENMQHDKPSVSLLDKAASIALTIAARIKADYPELLPDLNKPLLPEDFGQEYICKLLREKALCQKQDLKPSFETQVLQAKASAATAKEGPDQTKPEPMPEQEF